MASNAEETGRGFHSYLSQEQIAEDAGGYDYGCADGHMLIANNRHAELLGEAGVFGIAYGVIEGGDHPLPMLLLVGRERAPLFEAFAHMRRWAETGGPNAISLEICYMGEGYIVTLTEDSRSLEWRLRGFGNVAEPNAFHLTWVKPIDTRGPQVEDLADYTASPIAPAYLGAALARSGAGFEAIPEPIGEVSPLLIGGLRVYRSVDEVPDTSPMREIVAHIEADSEGMDPSADDGDAAGTEEAPRETEKRPASSARTAERREWRLRSIMAKTVHQLRHSAEGIAIVARFEAQGYDRWQIEQALANLNLAAKAGNDEDSPLTDWVAVEELRLGYLEMASEAVDLGRWRDGEIADQIARDSAYLLRRIDDAGGVMGNMQARLRDLGFVGRR